MKKTNLLGACAAALVLASCGGGGDSATPPPATNAFQGLWQGQSADGASTVSALVLPDGRFWLATIAAPSTTRPTTESLVKATLGGPGPLLSGVGRRHLLDGGATAPLVANVSANAVEKVSLNGGVSATGVSEGFSLAYLSRYDTPAVLAQHAGTWSALLGVGVVNWTISDTGVLSGSRTTGCTYTGQVGLRPERKAIVEVAITENCAGASTQLSGVGVLSAGNSRFVMFLTTAGESSAAVLSLAR